jgi:hypothetical protein
MEIKYFPFMRKISGSSSAPCQLSLFIVSLLLRSHEKTYTTKIMLQNLLVCRGRGYNLLFRMTKYPSETYEHIA